MIRQHQLRGIHLVHSFFQCPSQSRISAINTRCHKDDPAVLNLLLARAIVLGGKKLIAISWNFWLKKNDSCHLQSELVMYLEVLCKMCKCIGTSSWRCRHHFTVRCPCTEPLSILSSINWYCGNHLFLLVNQNKTFEQHKYTQITTQPTNQYRNQPRNTQTNQPTHEPIQTKQRKYTNTPAKQNKTKQQQKHKQTKQTNKTRKRTEQNKQKTSTEFVNQLHRLWIQLGCNLHPVEDRKIDPSSKPLFKSLLGSRPWSVHILEIYIE